MAVKINLRKAAPDADPGASKFFGSPTVPNEWNDNRPEDVIFFCQIRLSDIAELDAENLLPHTGYLYIFLDVEAYPCIPMVYYYDGQPDTVLDDFNEAEPDYAHLTQAYEMEFEAADDGCDGMKLFGTPSDWSCAEEPPRLFMQFDPYEGLGFMDSVDGYLYFFFDREDIKRLDNITLFVEMS